MNFNGTTIKNNTELNQQSEHGAPGFKIFLIAVALSVTTLPTFAAELSIPNEFTAGTSALAAEVNGNFSAAATAVNDNNSRIVTLEATVAQLQGDNASLQNFLSSVVPYLRGGLDNQGNPAVFFSGVNLHVNNGDAAESTDSINGLGNLIVGFDESTNLYGPFFCLDPITGEFTDSRDRLVCANATNATYKTGSHNLVVGSFHTYTNSAGIVAGRSNGIAGLGASILGGSRNVAIGDYSAVSGGGRNSALGLVSSVSGGGSNVANGLRSAVSGGKFRSARDTDDWVAGALFQED